MVDAAYDAGGRPTGIVYPEASVGLLYNDNTDRVRNLTRTPSFGGTTQQITYTYDGSLVTGQTFTGVANGAFTFTYDNNFFLRQIGLVSGSNTVTTPITRDIDGLVTGYGPFTFTRSGPAGAVSQINGTAMNIAVTYDTLGRVATRTHTVNGLSVYSIQLTYDSTGNISRKIESVSGVQTTWDYTYDADGQLVKTKKNGADAETFAYDVNGNRTSHQRPNSWTTTSEYDDQDRIVWQGGVAYQLNADGQDTFQYTATGELLQATISGQTITYSYDGMGRRVARTDSKGTCQYLYGNLKQPFQLTAMRDPVGMLSYYYYDDTGKLFAFDKGGTRYYVATDQVGTPKVVSDATGNIVKYLEHDSFGMWTFDSNPDFDMPVGYAGGVVDSQTTLVRFGYRDYEPYSGRWTAKDPIFFKGGMNLFGYVQNNPVNFRDPLGLQGEEEKEEEVAPAETFAPLEAQMLRREIKELDPTWAEISSNGVRDTREELKSLRDQLNRLQERNSCPARQKGKRWKSGDDPAQQLEEIERAQQAARQGKLDHPIDSIEKSNQRLDNWLKGFKY